MHSFLRTKLIGFTLLLFCAGLIPVVAYSQSVTHGREQAIGVFHFDSMARYYETHPETPRVHEEENEAHTGVPGDRTAPDSSLIRRRAAAMRAMGASTTTALLPVSPSPTDSFRAILDNNTSIPPDTHGDIDGTYCVTAINPNVRIQTRAGATVSTVTLDQFFRPIVPAGNTFDPRINYDPYAQRWYLIADANGGTDSNLLIIAVSQTSNPTGAWYQYRIVTDASGVSWWDYPTVGFNKKWITVSGNRFNVATNAFQDNKIFVFDKATMLTGGGAPFTAFLDTASTISPAITYDTTQNSIYLVEKWNSTSGLIKLSKITGSVGSETRSTVGFPASSIRWHARSNAVSGASGADFAPQAGTSRLIQTNDDRFNDLKFINNTLWCSHTVHLPYSSTANATRTSVQWWQLDTTGNPLQLGLIDDPSNNRFFFFPSIAVNQYNDALIGFSTTTSSSYASAAYALHLHSEPDDSTRPHVIYRNGANSYYKVFGGSRNRWGDYSNTSVDPTNMTDFWTIQEVASSTANVWDTWWANVRPCSPPSATVTASGPTSFCTGGSVVLSAPTGTGITYQWQVGGIAIAGATASSYTATVTGNYAVVVSAASCDSTSAIIPVTVSSSTATPITASTTALCVGQSITASHATTGGTWATSDASIASISVTGVINAIAAGTVTISYSATSACGPFTQTLGFTVNALPTVTAIAGATSTCVGSSLTLTNATTGGVWASGNPTVATISASGVVTGRTNGSATISYTVTSGSGCSTTVTTSVTVTSPFSATATAGGATSFCTGGSVVLSATTGSFTYQWQLGGTNITGATNNTYTANATGNYTAIVSQGGCSVTTGSIAVTVLTTYAAPITGATGVCTGGTTILSDSTAGGTWSTSNASIASINSSGVVTGITPGTVTITYTYTNICGTATRTAFMTVSNPISVAAIAGTLSACPGATSTLTNATALGVWSSSNTSVASISTTGIVTGINAGTATISYSVTNATGCVSFATASFTVIAPPTATITPAGATTICLGARVTLNGTTGSGLTYQWQVGGVNISGATLASYAASASGSYGLIITNAGGCSATATPITVTVTGTLSVVPALTLTTSPGTVLCTGTGAVSFTPNPVNGGSSPAYTWYLNGTVVSTATSYSYTPTNGDVVACKLTSNATCAFPDTAIASATMTVNPYVTPSVAINAIPSDTVCEGSTGAFTANPSFGGSAPSYTWNKNGTDVYSGPAYYYVPADGDVLICKMRSNYICRLTDDVSSAPLIVHVIPVTGNTVTITATATNIYAGQSVTFSASTSGAGTISYQWLINGIAIPGATAATFTTTTLSNGQVVKCRVTSSDRCTAPTSVTSSGITILVSSGINAVSHGNDYITVEPNPNRGSFHVKGNITTLQHGAVTIKVTNMLGQIVYQGNGQVTNNVLNESVALGNNMADGIYITTVTLNATGMDYVFRVIVSK